MFDEVLKKLLEHKELSYEEAGQAMSEIMSGSVSAVKLAAWLVALRMKGETAGEIAGCAAEMQKHAIKVSCSDDEAIDIVGTGGDGFSTINVSTISAFVVAGAGITVAKHGNRAVSSKSGSADVLGALGININITPEQMAECLDKIGIAFLFAPSLHPAMKHAMPVRKELGARSIFNILGPLSNPARVKRLLLGVYSEHLCSVMAEALLQMGIKRAMVVHGGKGLDEISVLARTRICEIRHGKIDNYFISPEEMGMEIANVEDIRGGNAEENAMIARQILAGQENGAKRNIVIINSAGAIICAGKADNWQSAVSLAVESIDSGAALNKLDTLVRLTQSF